MGTPTHDEIPLVEPRLAHAWFPRPSVTEWICLIAGAFLTIHYSWLLDDAYIYFRYADNLLYLDYGLVFNAGEQVEAYSSPLWMLLLIGLRATGLNYWIMVRVVGVLAFVVFWGLLVVLNRRMSPPRTPTLNFPLCYLTLNYAVLCYFTSGLESPLVQIAAAVYALWVVKPKSRALQVLLALTPILRHELALPFAICLVWLWVRERRFPALMTLAGVVFTGGWVGFRVYYYADLFPNTFYLKDTVDFAQGLLYMHDTARPYWLYVVAPVFVALALLCAWRGRTKPVESRDDGDRPVADGAGVAPLQTGARLMMLILAGAIAAYVAKIGGDPRHYRYLAFPFCLCVCASAGLIEHCVARFSIPTFRVGMPILGLIVAGGAFACYPRQLESHPAFGQPASMAIDRIADSAGHRYEIRPDFPRFVLPAWGSGDKIEFRDRYAEHLARGGSVYTKLTTRSGCAILYEEFYARVVHGLGLTDPILARTEMEAIRPAHKFGLMPLSNDLGRIIFAADNTPYRGMYRDAVEAGTAPPWIGKNLEAIEIIERKMLNQHDFLENLRLAFTFPEKIIPPPSEFKAIPEEVLRERRRPR